MDGRVCQFSRWDGIVVPNRRSPGATGYQIDLYALHGFSPEGAQQIEQKFFKHIDDVAADALRLLERFGHRAPWDSGSRSAWTRFLLSLLLRCPEDIAAYREWWPRYFAQTDEASELRYSQSHIEGEPPTLAEFILNRPSTETEKNKFEALMQLIDHEDVGVRINDMHWRVLQIPEDGPALMTSDRPVMRSHSLTEPGGHIALPIGPRLLFIASHDLNFLEDLRRARLKELAKECNRQVTSAAVRYVYAEDDASLSFVQKRMGSAPQPRVIDDIIRRNPCGARA